MRTDMPRRPDQHLCPLCHQPNQCVMAGDGAPHPCWCNAATFTPELLARVPASAARKVCICRNCAETAAKAAAASAG